MPAAPRQETIDESTVGIYHVFNRCSQNAKLLGYDPNAKKDVSHRKEQLLEKMAYLAGFMAVDVLDYAILDNHFHLVVRNRPDVVEVWTDEEVIQRWWQISPGRRDKDGNPEPISDRELKAQASCEETVKEYRKRLSSISWFMRMLCQPIARQANKESGVTGRFFAHRFGCKRILDMAGLLACSMYVDLNLVRAGIAETPESSEFTSAFARIQARALRKQTNLGQSLDVSHCKDAPDAWLAPLLLDERSDAFEGCTQSRASNASIDAGLESPSDIVTSADAKRKAAAKMAQCNPFGSPRASEKGFLPMSPDEYFRVLDWTGRHVRSDKKAGAIPADLKPILERLQVRPGNWLQTIRSYDKNFRTAVGTVEAIRAEAKRRGRRWLQGVSTASGSFL